MVPVKNALRDASLKNSDIDEVILVGGSTRIPAVRKVVEDFFEKKANSSVNPDEVVAMGAAIQGGIITGDIHDILLLDVTPLSLGIETMGGICTRLIERNTTIPCQKSETFSTAADSQLAVDVNVLQGEREFAADNRTLGQFRLDGIPPAPRGIPQIEVTFDIDANGIVSASAKDKATGKEQKITITGGSSLSDDEVKSMVDDAAAHEEDDQKKRDIVLERNKLDSLVYQSQKLHDENSEKLSAESLANVKDNIDSATEAIDSDDLDQLKSSRENLESALYAAGAELASAAATPEPEAQTPESNDDDVIDAEFEEASQ
jgi:molecular chaperone DnaK